MNAIKLKSLGCTFIMFLCIGASFGQNYTLVPVNQDATGSPKDLLLPTVEIHNTTSQPLKMKFKRLIKDIPSGWTSCFCWPSCISPLLDSLAFTVPGNSFVKLSPNFGTDSVPGFGRVKLVLHEDTISPGRIDTLVFTGSTLSITTSTATFTINTLQIYPNPVCDVLYLKGIEDVKSVEIYNITGELVRTILMNSPSSSISLADLKSGSYLIKLSHKHGNSTINKIVKFL